MKKRKLILLYLLFFSPIVFSCVSNTHVEKKSCTILTEDGAWCWFADPRAIYYEGKYERTYIGWVNKSGDIQISRYDHRTKEVITETIKDSLDCDDHANPALLMLNDGRLMVFYSAHSKEPMYYRTMKYSENISEWENEKVVGTNTLGKRGITYPNPIQLKKEDNVIYLFWRGGNFKPSFAKSRDGIEWTQAKTLIEGRGSRPYIKYASDGIEKIHFAFTDGHPNREEKNSIYYAYYYNGALYRADGSKIKGMEEIPIKTTEADKIYDSEISGTRSWIWDIALDNLGNPVIVYAVFPELTDHRYRYAKWTGSMWIDNEIVSANDGWFPQTPEGERETEPFYSGGIALDHADPSILYLSRKESDVFEIEKWVTSDNGASWGVEKITSGSEKNNIRPVVIRNYSDDGNGLIWMYGDYIHYTKYSTAIKMK